MVPLFLGLMKVALEALLSDVGGESSVPFIFPVSGFLYPLDGVEGDGELHQVDFSLSLPFIQDHKVRPLGSHNDLWRDGATSCFPALEVGVEGQTFQPWGSESFEKVEENLVMSIGEPALIQGHFTVGKKVAKGAGRVGAMFAPWVNISPPP